MNLVIFGPPGAGKGTQSNLIVNQYNLFQLSTGELLRKEIKNNSKLGKEISEIINSGNLVSDKVVGELIEKYLSNENFKNRLIFDGYPRNLTQAENLNNLLEKYDQRLNIVLKLNVNLNTIKERILARKSMEGRADDTEKLAIKRYMTYEKNIQPVIDFYKKTKLLKVVNGEASVAEISGEISGLIDTIKGWLWGKGQYKYAQNTILKFMARIAGINIPQNKVVSIALTYIHGIGLYSSKKICKKLDIPLSKRVNELSEDQVLKIREFIDANYKVEGDLRREISINIKRLVDLASYRGSRHKKKLPVRGQRTQCNARTRKGKAIAIAGKKLTPLKK